MAEEHPCLKCAGTCTPERKAKQMKVAWGCESYKRIPVVPKCPICGMPLKVVTGRCYYKESCGCGYEYERDSSD